MRQILLIAFVLFSQIIQAQDVVPKDISEPIEVEDSNNPIPIQVIEQIPVFPGCENIEENLQMECFNSSISKHIQKTLVYPKEAVDLGISAKVLVIFLINKDGSVVVTRTKSMQGGAEIFEAEARRIIEKLPKMKPGIQRGKPVIVSYTIPINFMADIEEEIKE